MEDESCTPEGVVHGNVCGGLEEGSNLKRSQPSNRGFYRNKMEALKFQRFGISENLHTRTAYRKKTLRPRHGDTTDRFSLEQDV